MSQLLAVVFSHEVVQMLLIVFGTLCFILGFLGFSVNWGRPDCKHGLSWICGGLLAWFLLSWWVK